MQNTQDMVDALLTKNFANISQTGACKISTINSSFTFYNGKFHSFNDDPAINYAHGMKMWVKDGKLSRISGPAVSSSNLREWWIDGKLHRDEKDEKGLSLPAIIFSHGDQSHEAWYINGVLSRDWREGPACKSKECEQYYVNGLQHRGDDLPAVVSLDSCEKEWWMMGKRHRDGGLPAVIRSGDVKEYWFLGNKY
jgi:hypothetical protein